ncbi:hypothetical protein FC756_21905 [Lysinibacillus mangiferihumi]|uniref:Uncharacterized protein n=1 Tax=Lysinibacillus mangiferihumi TaxID=1130819 RepID=A0A4U2Y0H0_9BACI|nr:hypothetical protein FC756_21905 [Lysinibacillus mangiferihumi]
MYFLLKSLYTYLELKRNFSKEGSFLNWISKNKKPFLAFIVILIIIAGLLDIKYEGLFFQMLPKTVQDFLANLF